MELFVTPFNHRLMRRYLLAFGTLFDSLVITREDDSDHEFFRENVPIEYGPKERWLVRLTQDPDFTKGVAQVVPRIAYELTGISYDTTRKINTLEKLTFADADASKRARLYVGVPYTMTVRLSILVKLQQDGMQLVEQILPFFTPDYTIAVRPLHEFNDLVDTIPITLQSISHSDNYEGDFIQRRVIIWDLEFSMKVYFYGPIRSKKHIQEVNVNLHRVKDGDLSEPRNDAYPLVNIHVIADPLEQTPSSPDDVTANTTITEYEYARSTSPSASPSPSS